MQLSQTLSVALQRTIRPKLLSNCTVSALLASASGMVLLQWRRCPATTCQTSRALSKDSQHFAAFVTRPVLRLLLFLNIGRIYHRRALFNMGQKALAMNKPYQ